MACNKNIFCFVCDIAVTNRYFSLATCRTQSSKKKLLEKLGQLVGDKYMVVVTEDDVICRSCANLMNTLDRLEVEMASVKRVVLRFLERKYGLDEGELSNQSPTNESSQASSDKSVNFMVRKRKAEQEAESGLESNPDDPKSRIWMQCNQCQYTTNYSSFINNHVRKDVCLNCEAPLKSGTCSADCNKTTESETQPKTSKQVAQELLTDSVDFLKETNSNDLTGITDVTDENNRLAITLTDPNGELVLNENNELLTAVEGDENKETMYLQVVDPEEQDSNNVRQVFAVSHNGSIKMMEVLWNDQEASGSVEDIQFE